MSETRNITLALPKALLKRARLLAVERETSVSRLLAETLEDLVNGADAYEQARQRHLALLDQGFDLGTGGEIRWSRDSLHER